MTTRWTEERNPLSTDYETQACYTNGYINIVVIQKELKKKSTKWNENFYAQI